MAWSVAGDDECRRVVDEARKGVRLVGLSQSGSPGEEPGAGAGVEGRSTVKAHISHIVTKLGIANRTELTAAAIDRDLCTAGRSPTA